MKNIQSTKQNDITEFLLYKTPNGGIKVEVFLFEENIWLSQKMMASLFACTPENALMHLKNIYESGELSENATTKDFLVVQKEGNRDVSRNVKHYNLDAIISVGYRVNSSKATQFRIWATERLKEYIIKGFTMDDKRLKEGGGGTYWKELLSRIRDIRSSEKALYRQVLDLYATSIDYDPKSEASITFFKIVQNKLHYATNKQTAAETIYTRADSEKEFMGLTTFSGAFPILSDVGIAKNYLTEDELFRMNRLVSAFFDLAEIRAQEHTKMTMVDWIHELDRFTTNFGKGTLEDAGSISNKNAVEKATTEYRKYQAKTLSPVEKDYLQTLKSLQKSIKTDTKST